MHITTWSDFQLRVSVQKYILLAVTSAVHNKNILNLNVHQQITAQQLKNKAPIQHSDNFILSINNYVRKFNKQCSCAF